MKGRVKIVAFLLMVGFLAINNTSAQNISGTINIYTDVTNVAGADVTVGSAAGFAVCDRVLIIQMKGATINTANNATFGQITGYGDAGNYEFASIASIAGNVITLSGPLGLTYTVTGNVQLVRVPVYNNPTITAPLTCTPWNGTTGGVVVFESTGPVVFNADIDVSGDGFVGGAFVSGGFGCNNANYATATHGRKGEGIATAPAGMDRHRAPLANGGGGSSPGNCGGGGGSNYGTGGRGGNEYSGCGNNGIFGIGGEALTAMPTKAFLGGGGGGGYRDNGQTCASGSNGGGIVIINAPSIDGNNFSILANGDDVTILTNDEGAGGGGGGGSVHLMVPTYTSPINVNVDGGDGGDIQNSIFTSAAHGPGGGGGAGYVYISPAAAPANLMVSANGGLAGLVLHNGAWLNTTFNGVDGSPGATLFNLPITPLASTTMFPPVNLGHDTIICGTGGITLQPDTVYNSYTWSTGASSQSINVGTTGTYWLEVPVGCGQTDRDSIQVTFSDPMVNLGPDQSFCVGDSVSFDAGPGFVTYWWNTTETSQSIYANSIGTYMVLVTDAYGCTATGQADVTSIYPLPVVDLGQDQSFCTGNSTVLSSTGNYASYLWQDGSANPTYTASNNGTYVLYVTDANGCQDADSVDVTVHPLPTFSLGPDQKICPEHDYTMQPVNGPAGSVTYLWHDGSTDQTYTYSDEGTITLEVTDLNGCVYSDTVQISIACPPYIYVPNAFTPNEDEINPIFKAYGTNVKEFTMEIFDRWGERIFWVSDINDGWNGTYKDNPAPIGTYVYKITYKSYVKDDEEYLIGRVTLIR